MCLAIKFELIFYDFWFLLCFVLKKRMGFVGIAAREQCNNIKGLDQKK